jgi:hypothetical protein
MIVFDLSCAEGHGFEGWFRNANDYSDQLNSGLLSCPICGNRNISKKPSASHLSLNKQQADTQVANTNTRQLADQIIRYIETNFEDVGHEFRNEALKMHYGEKEKRNIKGVATYEDAAKLKEEGIDIYQIPDISKQKLN